MGLVKLEQKGTAMADQAKYLKTGNAPQRAVEDGMATMMECYSDMAEYLRIIALYFANKGIKEGVLTEKEVNGEG